MLVDPLNYNKILSIWVRPLYIIFQEFLSLDNTTMIRGCDQIGMHMFHFTNFEHKMIGNSKQCNKSILVQLILVSLKHLISQLTDKQESGLIAKFE